VQRYTVAAIAALSALPALAPVSARAGLAEPDSRFAYVGQALQPQTGSGVQGVTYLRFTLTGKRPRKGQCEKHLTVDALFDGKYSPKILMAQGFVESPQSRVVVCRDPVTGKLTEKLRIEMELLSQGVLVAGYSWISNDPRKGPAADTIVYFANVEYHTSVARQAGLFSSRRVPGPRVNAP
jgi:hypothetical protein